MLFHRLCQRWVFVPAGHSLNLTGSWLKVNMPRTNAGKHDPTLQVRLLFFSSTNSNRFISLLSHRKLHKIKFSFNSYNRFMYTTFFQFLQMFIKIIFGGFDHCCMNCLNKIYRLKLVNKNLKIMFNYYYPLAQPVAKGI